MTDIQTAVPRADLALLEAHLPYSYSLLRRCQFTHRPQGHSPHAHYLVASDRAVAPAAAAATPPRRHRHHFAAAYVDLSKGPETEVFIYSTLQDHAAEGDGTDWNGEKDGDDAAGAGARGEEEEERKQGGLPLASLPADEVDHVLDLILALFRRIKEIAASASASASASSPTTTTTTGAGGYYTLHRPHGTMVGGLHEGTYRLLVQRRGVRSSYWNPHDVWLFRLDRLPPLLLPTRPPVTASRRGPAPALASLMRWDVVRREDVPLIASRTKIPKVEATLMSEPSVVVRVRARTRTREAVANNKEEEEGDADAEADADADADGHGEEETLIAWGFMGIAGTLSTLHVEVSPFFFFFFWSCMMLGERVWPFDVDGHLSTYLSTY